MTKNESKKEIKTKALEIIADTELVKAVIKELKLTSMPLAAEMVGVARQHLYMLLKGKHSDVWVIEINTGEQRGMSVIPLSEVKRIIKERKK